MPTRSTALRKSLGVTFHSLANSWMRFAMALPRDLRWVAGAVRGDQPLALRATRIEIERANAPAPARERLPACGLRVQVAAPSRRTALAVEAQTVARADDANERRLRRAFTAADAGADRGLLHSR